MWSAMRAAKELRQCLLYLVAFFMLQESESTTDNFNYKSKS